MYNGEVNVEEMDNGICELQVYNIIHNLQEDDIKIQLPSLSMEGTTLVWWEARTQYDIKNHSNMSMYSSNFIYCIKRKSYPLDYMQKFNMDW